MNNSLIIVWIFAIILLMGVFKAYAQNRPPPKEGQNTLVWSIGASTNARQQKDGTIYGLTYSYEIIPKVKASFAFDITNDSSEFVGGVALYPFKFPFYITMGIGALDAKSGGEVVVRASGGYEINFHPKWFADLRVGSDYVHSGVDRTAGMIGIGKRF